MSERVETVLSDQPVPDRHVFHSPTHGAEIQFRGVVRGWEEGRRLEGIRYSAYAPMATAKLRALATEAASTHPEALVFIHHVVGFVPAGEASVLLAIAMPHSAEAFALCAEMLRRLKTEVPIWKELCWR
jgi:molybdopterin synthase catalytic subunit